MQSSRTQKSLLTLIVINYELSMYDEKGKLITLLIIS